MAIRSILQYPDKRLRVHAEPVGAIDADLLALIEDMKETMYAAPGVGLAATQVGVAKRLFIVDTAAEDEASQLRIFINPEIVRRDGQLVSREEGCLSFPGVHETIERAAKVTVAATDERGERFNLTGEGLLAVAIQHEYDHLEGILMIDHMGALRRRLALRKLKKQTLDAEL